MMRDAKYTLSFFLFKDSVKNIKDCLKEDIKCNEYALNERSGIDGSVIVGETKGAFPAWENFLNSLTVENIALNQNKPNKAILFCKRKGRIFAIVFGYGKSLLDLRKIDSNFGLITALNLIDEEKVRSINSATIDSLITLTQKQTNYFTESSEFDIGDIQDIITGINGLCKNVSIADYVNGREALTISVHMDPFKLNDKIDELYEAYTNDNYKDYFAFIDNVHFVRDRELGKVLDKELIERINDKAYKGIAIAPPSTVDWENVLGFMISGQRKRREDANNYNDEIDLEEYFSECDDVIDIEFLKKKELLCFNTDGSYKNVCTLYKAISVQLDYHNNFYVLFDGRWYEINKAFYDKVQNYILRIEKSSIALPDYIGNKNEEEYNAEAAICCSFALLDKKMCGVEGGPKKIEACDLLTADKRFIHVKKYSQSSALSHLFSQGRVAALCFLEDSGFRNEVYDFAKTQLRIDKEDFVREPKSDEIEVVYAIIAKKKSSVDNELLSLPFFSLVNLMMNNKELKKYHIRNSVAIIREA